MGKLNDKVAVITGASKGIGAAIAKALADEGASVVVNFASNKQDAQNVIQAITQKGGKAIAVQGDVGKSSDVEKLFAETKRAFGRVDILVNNAGIYRFSPILEVTENDFHQQFNTNVLGLLLAAREAVRHFGADGGTIINIGSAVTAITPPDSAIYTGTKGAVDVITRVLAKELGAKKIRVNSINPGMVETEGTQTGGFIGGDLQKQLEAQAPLGRIGAVSDIAPLAVFLASPDSGWLTGEILVASGGLR